MRSEIKAHRLVFIYQDPLISSHSNYQANNQLLDCTDFINKILIFLLPE